MVHIFTHLSGKEFIVRDPVHELSVSQFLGIQNQSNVVSIIGLYSLAQGNLK